jgi:ElaB/YqjD/DUF883 family membrane-anchored ribosome-binding protein
MEEVTDNAAPSFRLTSDLRALASDAEALLRHAAQDTGKGYSDARARLEQSVARTKERLAATEASMRDRARAAGGSVDEYVHENPWRAIGIGASVGLIIGVMIARR